ncbi:hypothetical protein CcaCcLH18_08297 [Colletotrichum camelliae]|nr:hypothetical protein CcaCcLH18_08297 [Colletotrichum camelliae]
MDPVTAIGLVSGILAFIDFSTKLVRGATQIYASKSGTPEDNNTIESAAIQIHQFSADLSIPETTTSHLLGNDAKLCELADEYKLFGQHGRTKYTEAKKRNSANGLNLVELNSNFN